MDSSVIVILLMIATLMVLGAGLVVMAFGGKVNKKYGPKLMVARVVLQALAILLLFVLMYVTQR